MKHYLFTIFYFFLATINSYSINNYSSLFRAEIQISTSPDDAEIFINDVFKGKGNVNVEFNEAMIISVTVKKNGYLTKTIKLKYKAPQNSEFTNLQRGKNYYSISLETDLDFKSTNNYINNPDIIYKLDGSEIQAKILEIDENKIAYKRFDYIDGPTIKLSKTEILHIEYQNGKIELFNKGIINSNDSTQKVFRRNNDTIFDNPIKNITTTLNTKEALISLNLTSNGLFPKLIPCNNPDLEITDFIEKDYNENSGFLAQNKDYFNTGKYMYYYGDKNFSSYKYPSLVVHSTNDLKNFNSIQVIFPGEIPFQKNKYYWHLTYSKADLEEHRDFYELENNCVEKYNELNAFYKHEINELLKAKKSNNINISDILNPTITNNNSLSNTLILQLSIDDMEHFWEGQSKWPDFVNYSLNILNSNGELCGSYHQVIFLKSPGRMKQGKYSIDFVKVTLKPAFYCLLNQFLNDEYTLRKIQKTQNEELKQIGSNIQYLSNIKCNLLNILFKKNQIVYQLNKLGCKFDGINPNGYINTNSLYSYNSNVSLQTNQMVNSVGQLAGSMANMMIANQERKRIEKINIIANKLKMDFFELNEKEKITINNLPSEIFNTSLSQYLPNSDALNKKFEEENINIDKKKNIAAQTVSNKFTSINSDLSQQQEALNTQSQKQTITPESSAISNSSQTNFNTNVAAAKKCQEDTDIEWKNSDAYQNFKNNQTLTGSVQLNGSIAKRKLVELTLKNCSQYLPQNEIEGYRKLLSDLDQTINTLQNNNYGK